MKEIAAVFVSAALMLPLAPGAGADPREYCESYARDVAAQRTDGTGILAGAAKGALLGAKVESTSAGEGASPADQALYARDYEQALNDCIAQYEAAPAVQEQPAAPKPQKLVQSAKLERGSQEWIAYCTAKYKSFNAEAGTYTSYTGVERPCRVTE